MMCRAKRQQGAAGGRGGRGASGGRAGGVRWLTAGGTVKAGGRSRDEAGRLGSAGSADQCKRVSSS